MTFHFLWMAAAAFWVIYSSRVHAEGHRNARLRRRRRGKANEIITPADKRFGGLWLAGSMLALLIFYAHANNEFPRTLPMQAGLVHRHRSDA